MHLSCRAAGVEVLYTVIQSLTADGRDRSLDYKISGFHIPPGSSDAQVRVSHCMCSSLYFKGETNAGCVKGPAMSCSLGVQAGPRRGCCHNCAATA